MSLQGALLKAVVPLNINYQLLFSNEYPYWNYSVSFFYSNLMPS